MELVDFRVIKKSDFLKKYLSLQVPSLFKPVINIFIYSHLIHFTHIYQKLTTWKVLG